MTQFVFADNSILKINGLKEIAPGDFYLSAKEAIGGSVVFENVSADYQMSSGSTTEYTVANAAYNSSNLGDNVEEVTILGSDDDFFIGSGLKDFIRTG